MANFFTELQGVSGFSDLFREDHFAKVPKDWFVIITDVVNSTIAIESGLYKDVNIAGSLPVIALAHLMGDMDYPFLFGGDGMTALVPPESLESVKDILADTRALVKQLYKLELRVGVVPVEMVYQAGKKLSAAKLTVSQYYDQAILDGDGLDWAEAEVKRKDHPSVYLVEEDRVPAVPADFRGYTCRWKDIPSAKGETISLLVKLRENEKNSSIRLADLYNQIEKILGGNFHPLTVERMKRAFNNAYLRNESRVQTRQKFGLKRFTKQLVITIMLAVSGLFEVFKWKVMGGFVDLSNLKNYNMINADYRKYDGTLKMVAAVDSPTRKELETFLEKLRQRGEIFYGVHVSNRALMTCMVHVSSSREVHFIDAADGGYALAAKGMKLQIKAAAPAS